MVAEYYSQRAGAGLMLTEAASWSSRGNGFQGAACLYNRDHLDGWKLVLDLVHAKGGVLFLQIFHAGRATHPLKNGGQ
jgi:N-ethylmaleimide reductase